MVRIMPASSQIEHTHLALGSLGLGVEGDVSYRLDDLTIFLMSTAGACARAKAGPRAMAVSICLQSTTSPRNGSDGGGTHG